MTVQWQAKDPDEVVVRAIDWSGRLLGAVINTSVLEVDDDAVSLSAIATGSSLISMTVSGGTAETVVLITNTIQTSTGKTLVETVFLPIVCSAAADLSPGGVTKQQIVDRAFAAATLSGYTLTADATEKAEALVTLDDLMAELAGPGQGLDLGYNFPTAYASGSLADVAGIPNAAVSAVALSLALRLFPLLGKSMSTEGRVSYAQSMSALRAGSVVIPESCLARGTPLGAGNRSWGYRRRFA